MFYLDKERLGQLFRNSMSQFGVSVVIRAGQGSLHVRVRERMPGCERERQLGCLLWQMLSA